MESPTYSTLRQSQLVELAKENPLGQSLLDPLAELIASADKQHAQDKRRGRYDEAIGSWLYRGCSEEFATFFLEAARARRERPCA